MFVEFVSSLGEWSWVILGLVLLVLEILAPGILFLWFGLAALIVGGLSFLIDMGWQSEAILFAALSLISVLVGRYILSRAKETASDNPMLNKRAEALVGQIVTLSEAIEDGHGRVRIQDSYWRVHGPDSPAGCRVKVIAGEETRLIVEPLAVEAG